MDAAFALRAHRQGHIDPFGSQLGVQFRRLERRLACVDGGLHAVLDLVVKWALFLPVRVRPAPSSERRCCPFCPAPHPHGFQSRHRTSVGDGLEKILFELSEVVHDVHG